ncbi:(2Fe-2S) ferredoxin [Aliiroseovarius halocynthiae]|uniref:(2Fe-2S) ferredoxin domain-containing protein n=1 Tax=Aliiroseovarius halocynthiae TaxID=985055 RepID=A0A545SLM4_9RHOB|nr:(2Fe-2S) ferredoxin domain-containing protein [Aliiroseovarius halocynthiae]TQV65880.1 (2Fe-2S) ferredoxin domain-containing protein [Aliiroseovarius halocynthiae]SMR83490.1 (2Fe-2S) ferredoxin [Aliiroseovarius halocynthiae]
MDAYLYLISASYVSQAKFRDLAETLIRAAPCTADAVRLEASGDGMWHALDALTAQGATRIELRPIGLPFSQSLQKWLPSAAGSWLDRQGPSAPNLFMAAALQADTRVVHSAARARVALTRIRPQTNGERGKGWDTPPAFRHHLLVCTGPRCHLKDAPSLVEAMKAELGRARVRSHCLVTTTGCLFPCNAGPVIVHYPHGNWYRVADLNDIRTFVAQALRANTIPKHLLIHQTEDHHEPA